MTGFDSKRQMAQDKMNDETRWDVDEDNPDSLAKHLAFQAALEQQAEPPPEWPLIKNILAVFGLDAIAFVAEWKAAQQQAEPVSQAVIAGALFDFMGWLTTRKERLILSSTDDASPAADAIKVFAEMRGLSLNDARVQDWQNYTTQQQAEPPQRPWVGLTDEEILSTDPWEILRADPWMGTSDSNINPYQILLKVRTLEAKLKERNT